MNLMPKQSLLYRIFKVFIVIFLVLGSSLLLSYNIIIDKTMAFQDIPSEESPFPLIELNETALHFVVQANWEENGFLGAEERLARYHSLMGFAHATVFQNGFSPDDENITPSTAIAIYPRSLGDAAFLTGLALYGEALRWNIYNSTGNIEGQLSAESQIARYLEGIYILTHITGTPGELVRFAFPKDLGISESYATREFSYQGRISPAHSCYNPNYPNNQHYYDEYNFSNWFYYDDTSRDQNIGVMMGLAGVMAFCNNDSLKGLAGERVQEIVDYFIESHWFVNTWYKNGTFPNEKFSNAADFDVGILGRPWGPLAFLRVAAVANPEKYEKIFREYYAVYGQSLKLIPENVERYAVSGYYPFNLGWLVAWMLGYFTPRDDPIYTNLFQLIKEKVYYPIRNHRNAWFQSLYLSLMSDYQRKQHENSRIIAEIRDALARLTRMKLKHFNGLWEYPFAEIGINYSNPEDIKSLFDYSGEKYQKFLDDLNLNEEIEEEISIFKPHLKYALPIEIIFN